MAKTSSYIKALLSTPSKAIRNLPHWENYMPMSPKERGDLSGLVVTKTGSDYQNPKVNIKYLQKIYECHDLVWTCIELVSSTFALGRLKVRKLTDGKLIDVPNHPLQMLLDNPNSTMTGFDLRKSFIVHRLLFGTVAFILLRGHMTSNGERNTCPQCLEERRVNSCPHILWEFNEGPITQMIPVHLDRIDSKSFTLPDGTVKEYFIYDPSGGGDKMPVHPNNILTDPVYSTDKTFYGTSPTAKVQRWIEIDLGLTKQIGAYFQNNAIPSMLINLKPSAMPGGYDRDPSELMNMMKENWMKKFSMIGDGKRPGTSVKAPAFVYGDVETQKIQDTLKEIVNKPLFYEIQNRIAAVYGVPRSMFEFGLDYSSQSSTVKQQRMDFYNDAISNQLFSFKAKIEAFVVPTFDDPDLKLEWDLSEMGVASFLEEQRKAEIFKRWEMGLATRDDTRSRLGLDPMEDSELGNDLYRVSVMSDQKDNSESNTNIEDNNLIPDRSSFDRDELDFERRRTRRANRISQQQREEEDG